jgi:hypothetical protein
LQQWTPIDTTNQQVEVRVGTVPSIEYVCATKKSQGVGHREITTTLGITSREQVYHNASRHTYNSKTKTETAAAAVAQWEKEKRLIIEIEPKGPESISGTLPV